MVDRRQRYRTVSQLLWSHKVREEWFSLGENHGKLFRFGRYPLRNGYSLLEEFYDLDR
jgi:hypothetical protein